MSARGAANRGAAKSVQASPRMPVSQLGGKGGAASQQSAETIVGKLGKLVRSAALEGPYTPHVARVSLVCYLLLT